MNHRLAVRLLAVAHTVVGGAPGTAASHDTEAALSAEMRGKGADPMDIDDKVAAIKADPTRYKERAGATGQLATRQLVAEEALRLVAELRSEMRAKVIIEEDIDDKIAAIHANPARYKKRGGATGELAQVLAKAGAPASTTPIPAP